MTTARLAVTELDPVVAQEQPQFATERYRLAEVRQEERASRVRHDPKVSNRRRL
jgi:hypothetical protein